MERKIFCEQSGTNVGGATNTESKDIAVKIRQFYDGCHSPPDFGLGVRELIPVKRNWRYIGCYIRISSAHIEVSMYGRQLFFILIFLCVCLMQHSFFFPFVISLGHATSSDSAASALNAYSCLAFQPVNRRGVNFRCVPHLRNSFRLFFVHDNELRPGLIRCSSVIHRRVMNSRIQRSESPGRIHALNLKKKRNHAERRKRKYILKTLLASEGEDQQP